VKECAISPTARAGAALPTISRTIHENLTTEPPSVEPFEVRSSLLRALFCGITVDFRLVAAPRTALTNTSTDFSKIVACYILTFPALVRMAVMDLNLLQPNLHCEPMVRPGASATTASRPILESSRSYSRGKCDDRTTFGSSATPGAA
jgi:hypothetical protein